MFSFTYPYLLLLLLLLPVIFILLKQFRGEATIQFSGVKPFKRIAKPINKWSLPLPYWFYLSALAILFVALAQPRWGSERILIRSEGIDIMLAVDLSGSMVIYDLPNNMMLTESAIIAAKRSGDIINRMDTAKIALESFIEQRPNDRFGLIGFAESAYSFAPPTLDHGAILDYVKTLEPNILDSTATGITSPIISAVRQLSHSKSERRVMVLFTDGDNNVNHTATPLEAAELAKAKDVVIYTVGIGGDIAVVIFERLGNYQVVETDSGFSSDLLVQIAETTGGKYFDAKDEDGLLEVMAEINEIEKTSTDQPKMVDYHHFAPNLAALALLLVLIGFSLESTIKLRLP